MSAKIYVACHKRDNCLLKLDNPIYIPIHCGKDIFKEDEKLVGYLPSLGDNTGDNISKKNPNYCELTAAYWIWKNDTSAPDDIVGLNHYRRYFSEPNSGDMVLMKEETMEQWLSDAQFIVNGCGTDYDGTRSDEESAYNGFKQNHHIEDLDLALAGAKELFPDIFPRVEHELKHSGAQCLCNMFITRKKYFDEYCEFLFGILGYAEARIDLTDDYHNNWYAARVFGFIGERMLRPWLMAKGYVGRQAPSLNWEKFSGYIWT